MNIFSYIISIYILYIYLFWIVTYIAMWFYSWVANVISSHPDFIFWKYIISSPFLFCARQSYPYGLPNLTNEIKLDAKRMCYTTTITEVTSGTDISLVPTLNWVSFRYLDKMPQARRVVGIFWGEKTSQAQFRI